MALCCSPEREQHSATTFLRERCATDGRIRRSARGLTSLSPRGRAIAAGRACRNYARSGAASMNDVDT
ncbi:hypothetical protein ACFPRL_19355 [Pseudoclavibacter helvolus]